jgi:3-dehydroquinate synthase
MRTIAVETPTARYKVMVGAGLLASLGRRIAPLAQDRVFVLTSPPVWALWGEQFLAAFGDSAQPVVLFLPAGERAKRLREVERLLEELSAAGADRSSLLVAFGGGIVGDVGGFLAAIYMRGIRYVQVPTTVLAQVDSSVGGKTGVNLAAGKNLAGAFHHPAFVLADVDLLRTLPANEMRAGLMESVKAGIIRDKRLFGLMERRAAELLGPEPDIALLPEVIARSVAIKAAVVGADEREGGLRMILNLGHTIGHAIEAVTKYRVLLHGEAVGWGMLVAIGIAEERGLMSSAEGLRARSLIGTIGQMPGFRASAGALIEAAGRDKKNAGGTRRFVLPHGIGDAVVVEDVTDGELLQATEQMLAEARIA